MVAVALLGIPESSIALSEPLTWERWQSAAAAWLAEVRARTGSDRTPAEYARWLHRFVATLGSDPARATPADVHAFAYGPGRSGREPSPSTVIVRLAAISGFYQFARRMHLLDANPAADVQRPKLRPPTPKGLTADELRRLLSAMSTKPSGLRDRAITITIGLTGLRRAEVMSLRECDLSEKDGRLFYSIRVKGGNERHRELPMPAYKAICAALQAAGHPFDQLDESEHLFLVSASGYSINLGRAARRAGLGNVTPHVLRHSAAKLRRTAGASIEDVQQLLGHSSMATTARYLARLEGEQDAGWQAAAALLGLT